MIVFVTQNANPIEKYRRTHGAPIAGIFRVMSYAELQSARSLPRATYCFADLELLSDEERSRAAVVRDVVTERGDRALNHPTRTLRRYELLRTLHRLGGNRFDVARVESDAIPTRYPVFLRGEHDHDGSRSGLLHDAGELQHAIDRDRRGEHPTDGLLAVEFLDTADATGTYRKYGAFIIGDRVFARHLFLGTDWELKQYERVDDDALHEELDYVTTNPHEERLRELFRIAHVEYGRIDYSVLDDTIQVWEINTNPVIAGRLRDFRPKDVDTLPARWGRRARSAVKPALRHVPGFVAARDRLATEPPPSPRALVHEYVAQELRSVWEGLA